MYRCTPKVRAAAQSKGEKISYHKLPEDKAVREVWIVKIKCDEFVVIWHSKVCSLHFTKELFQRSPDLANSIEFMLKAELLPDAGPTLFLYSKVKKHTCSACKKRTHSEVSFSNTTIISL